MEFAFLLIPAVLIVAIVLRLVAGSLDRDRIRQYVESRGGELIKTTWDPFGPGWFGTRNDRIYAVHYYDRDGHEHRAYCKTSMWTGVYFTEDRIVRFSENGDVHEDSLEDENRRLRDELDRLKRRFE